MARKLQPGLLVVDRTAGGGCEDYLTPEGTQAMPERFMPEAWEACMTLGDWWGWSKRSAYQSSGSVIRYLVRAVARNGNLLLDVGPDANGEMDPHAVKILKEIGAWLKVNGEAIYGTRPVEPYELGNVFFTGKADGTVYAIALSSRDGEPMPKSVVLPAKLTSSGRRITLVGGDSTVLSSKPGRKRDTTEVSLPSAGAVRTPIADAWVLKLAK
jgi:alpha-L-fucosidase